MQGACSDLSSTYSPRPNPLSPPASYSNSNSNHCHHVNTGTFSIMYFNARSLIPKFDELCLLVETHQPDTVCIIETWLDHNISDNEIHLPGFQLYRLDRNRHGGGVLMYAQHNLIVNVLPSQLQNNVPHNLEFLPISVRHNHFKVGIALFYKPPSAPSLIFDALFEIMENLNSAQFCNFIFLGDFNINFNDPSHRLYSKLCNISQLAFKFDTGCEWLYSY